MLNMPKFNMSPDDATKLVNYFAARDGAEYPYQFDERKREGHLDLAQSEYKQSQTLLLSIHVDHSTGISLSRRLSVSLLDTSGIDDMVAQRTVKISVLATST